MARLHGVCHQMSHWKGDESRCRTFTPVSPDTNATTIWDRGTGTMSTSQKVARRCSVLGVCAARG